MKLLPNFNFYLLFYMLLLCLTTNYTLVRFFNVEDSEWSRVANECVIGRGLLVQH